MMPIGFELDTWSHVTDFPECWKVLSGNGYRRKFSPALRGDFRLKSNSSEKLTQLLGKTFGTLHMGDVTAVGYQGEVSLL